MILAWGYRLLRVQRKHRGEAESQMLPFLKGSQNWAGCFHFVLARTRTQYLYRASADEEAGGSHGHFLACNCDRVESQSNIATALGTTGRFNLPRHNGTTRHR